eukprot:13605750-Alexandrium_andersonii.AAC.1
MAQARWAGRRPRERQRWSASSGRSPGTGKGRPAPATRLVAPMARRGADARSAPGCPVQWPARQPPGRPALRARPGSKLGPQRQGHKHGRVRQPPPATARKACARGRPGCQ